MTIQNALETIERLYPNTYSVGDKLSWLAELDTDVVKNVLNRHHYPISESFTTNGSDTAFTLANRYDVISRMILTASDGSRYYGYAWTFDKPTKVLTFTDGAPEAGVMHVCGEQREFDTHYTEDTAPSTELIIPAPYDQAYIYWLQSKIDYFNGEITRYNNASAMFDSTFTEFKKWYNRTHKPLESGWKYI